MENKVRQNTGTLTINKIPSRTWNKLKMNDSSVELREPGSPAALSEEIPDDISVSETDSRNVRIKASGLGDEFVGYMDDTSVTTRSYTKGPDLKSGEPVFQTIESKGPGDGISSFAFSVEKDSKLTVVQIISGDPDRAILKDSCHIAKGAVFNLIQIHRLSDKTEFLNDIGCEVEDGGFFKLTQIIIGNGRSYYGLRCDLSGKGSRLDTNIAYSVDGQGKLDMNYVADHIGKNSESDMTVRGVLKGKAVKLFRGTIDFHKGCAGAKGSEIENVLLMDDSVINQTIPVILCDEEDVEGSHGASIGKIDESILLYMNSRGISEKQAYSLMEQAQTDSVAATIDEDIRSRLVEQGLL